MFIVNSYSLAILFCFITMLCWGSWGNTQKLAGKTWRYELFYWDYVIGVLALSLIFAFTLGSMGNAGRSQYRACRLNNPGCKVRHTARKVKDFDLPGWRRRCCFPRNGRSQVVYQFPAGSQSQLVDADIHRTNFTATTAQKTIRHRSEGGFAVPEITQVVDGLGMGDAGIGRELAHICANAAPGAGIDLEISIPVFPAGIREIPVLQENQACFRKNVHVSRKGKHRKKTTQGYRISPPRRNEQAFEWKERTQHFSRSEGEKSARICNPCRHAFGKPPERENKPEEGERQAVGENVFRGSFHPQEFRPEALVKSHEKATQHKNKKQIHEGQEKIPLEGIRNSVGIEIFEENRQVWRVKAVVGKQHGFDFSHHDEQKPSEGQAHVHISKPGIIAKDPPVKQRFRNDLPCCGDGFSGKEIDENCFHLLKGGIPEPFQVDQRKIDKEEDHSRHKRPHKERMFRKAHEVRFSG